MTSGRDDETLGVFRDREWAVGASGEDPIRLDRVAPSGRETSTVSTEEDRTPDGVVEGLSRKKDEPEGDWSRVRRTQ